LGGKKKRGKRVRPRRCPSIIPSTTPWGRARDPREKKKERMRSRTQERKKKGRVLRPYLLRLLDALHAVGKKRDKKQEKKKKEGEEGMWMASSAHNIRRITPAKKKRSEFLRDGVQRKKKGEKERCSTPRLSTAARASAAGKKKEEKKDLNTHPIAREKREKKKGEEKWSQPACCYGCFEEGKKTNRCDKKKKKGKDLLNNLSHRQTETVGGSREKREKKQGKENGKTERFGREKE